MLTHSFESSPGHQSKNILYNQYLILHFWVPNREPNWWGSPDNFAATSLKSFESGERMDALIRVVSVPQLANLAGNFGGNPQVRESLLPRQGPTRRRQVWPRAETS